VSEDGELIVPQPNQPFSIHDPEAVWIVQSGKLDLFLVPAEDGEPSGAREHVTRVESGNAVFGLKHSLQTKTAVIAAAAANTQLLRLRRTRFQKLESRPLANLTADPIALLEGWVNNLSSAVSTSTPPKSFTELHAGETLDAGAEPKPVTAVKGILWVKVLGGKAYFQNNRAIEAIDGIGHFPVSSAGWLQPQPQSHIVALNSKQWDEADPEWQSLETFHNTVVECLLSKRGTAEARERKRLMSQAQVNEAIVHDALMLLAVPLQEPVARPLSSSDEEITNPVIAACLAAGDAIGLKMRAPENLRAEMRPRDIVNAVVRKSSVRHRNVALKSEWWKQAAGPLVAFRDADNQAVALLPKPRQGYNLFDPVKRTVLPVDETLAATLNGFAISLYRPFPTRKLTLWDLFRFGIKDATTELLTIFAMGIAGGLLTTVVPIATGIIFDTIIPSAQRMQLLEICGFLVFSAIATSLFSLTRTIATLRLEGKMGGTLQAAVWDRLLRLPVPFFRHYTSGDLADRSLGIDNVLRMVTGSVLSSVLSALFSIFSFVLLFYYSSELALIATGLLSVSFIVAGLIAYFQVRYQRDIFRIRGRLSGTVLEFIDNIARLRVAGVEPRAFAAWARDFAAEKKLSLEARSIQNGLTVFNSAFPVISLAVIFGYSAHMMNQPVGPSFSIGMFLAFLAAFVQFQAATISLSSTVTSMLGIVPLYERIKPILEAVPEVKEANKHPGELKGAIEMNHVNFRYRADLPLVLRDFSLSVAPGEFLGIVGPSGSGKSTLLRLLLGFEAPESGNIYYDGQDIAGLDIEAVRQQLGVVVQNARLGSGTIFNSIIGSAPLTLEDAWEAAARAGLDRDIKEMPMGMFTVIGEGGGTLSGGQRQRLLIARAMVRKPRIFMFDEATSALDNQTQATVRKSLDSFQATRIVIAHRLSTIANANHIVVMDRGVVLQTGSYEELISQEGLFRDLAKRQIT
jgi:NHLM bacteriocin system ABC transporter ATP-binding protein